MSTTKPQTLNFQFIFEMSIIFTLNISEMRVIFVVLISSIFALYPPNMSFLRDLFRNLPYASLQHWNIPLKVDMQSEFPGVRPIGFRKVILSNLKKLKKFSETKISTIKRSDTMDRTDESTV